MNAAEAIERLAQEREELRRRFDVRSLAIFGSVARNEAGPDSDLDVLVEFHGPATFDHFMGLKLRLEEMFGCRVDLATPPAIRERMRASVEKDLVHVP